MNTIKKHKWIWIIGGITLITGLVALLLSRADGTVAAEAEIGETVTAFIGDLSESATASGQVVAQREASLSLTTSGVVDQINIATGDEVKAGDALIQLERAALERNVASAEQTVIIAEAELANLLTGATEADIFAAEAAVLSAQARLDDLLDGPSEEQIAASEANVKAAQANIWSGSGQVQAATEVSEADILAAEANLNSALEQQEAAHNAWVRLADCGVNESGVHECLPSDNPQMDGANQNVQTAAAQVAIAQARLEELRNPDANNVASSRAGLAGSTAQYDAAVARHEALLLGASEAEIAAAEADLAGAQASLATLLAGPSESNITIYEIRLAQARTALQEALNNLADATLTAPFDGTITAVNVSEGELASGLVATIVDRSSLEVVLNVDEIDVGRLALDQPALVIMETWPEVKIESFVTAVAAHTLLVVDQFEELFTLCHSEPEQQAFVQNLTRAACQVGGPAIVIVVLRADFYAHCAHFDPLRQLLAQHQEYIGPMNLEELRCAIEEPALRGHWAFDPGLVDLLLHDAGADAGHSPEPGALPLLSHVLLATWQRRRGRTLTLSAYTASGGVGGAIAETAESVFYDQLDREQRLIARQIFLRLTELGGGDAQADTRRRATIDELLSKPEDREAVHQVLSALADARLVTTDQNAAEVAHEALIREWPTLRGWLEEDREGLRLHRHLTETAQEWEALGRDPGGLYRGARLAQALEWSAIHPETVNALERAFLDASQALAETEEQERQAQHRRELQAARQLAEAERERAEEQANANRRLRQRAVLLFVALFIAGTLAITAVVLGRRAIQAEQLATSRELAAAAVANLQVDAERSVLLALQALDTANTLEARNALHQALPELHLLRSLPAHEGGAADVAITPDGERLASMGAYGDITVWQAASGQVLLALRDEAIALGNSLAFSPDGRLLAAAGTTSVVIWDATTGEKWAALAGQSTGTTLGYNLGVGQISFSPDGERLAVANMDGLSKVWDLATKTELLALPPIDQPAKAMAYNAGGTLLATAGDEGIVTLWDARSGEKLFTLTLGGIIHSVTFSPDGLRVAAASEDGGTKIWDANSGEELLSLPRLSGMYDVAFLADGRLATAGQDGVTRVWDSATGQQLLTLASSASTVVGLAGSPDGAWIATSSYDGYLRLWDAAPGHELLTIPAHDGIVWNVAFSPDGRRFSSASVDGTVKLWESGTGRLLDTLSKGDNATGGFTTVAFCPDGTCLATGSTNGDIYIWDSSTGKMLLTLIGHSNYVIALAFDSTGARLASASWDETAKVWDLTTGAEMTTFSGHTSPVLIGGIAFSPDGQVVFTSGDDDFVRQWNASTGEEIHTFSGEGKDIYGLALSPDGQTLAMGDQDGMITLWDLVSGNRLRTFSGHAGLLLRLAFNKDGTRLASASFDRLAKVWDVASGEELITLYGNLSNVFGVSFSPDGDQLATAGADGTLRTYALELDQLVTLAQARLTRELTGEECNKFLHAEACP